MTDAEVKNMQAQRELAQRITGPSPEHIEWLKFTETQKMLALIKEFQLSRLTQASVYAGQQAVDDRMVRMTVHEANVIQRVLTLLSEGRSV